MVVCVYAETIFEHRSHLVDRMQGEEMIFHSPEFNLTVYLYPKENVTVLQDNFVEIPSVFDYYEGSEYNTLLYGTDEVYNVSRIYGTYYHMEPYVSHSYPDVPSLLMRVHYGCCAMLSREHHLQILRGDFEGGNFLFDYNGIPTLRSTTMVVDLFACSIFMCDQFSEESLNAYTPRSSYRFAVPFSSLSQSDRDAIAEEIRELFMHGYRHYLEDAMPAPQLDPLVCRSARFPLSDIPYMTLYDVLDTLHVLHFDDAFIDAVRRLHSVASFDYDVNVSLFETIIRVQGGLLSAHMLLLDNTTLISDYNARHPETLFDYDGHLLRLAVDLADRLLLAFRDNGLAFGTVNLRYGVPKNETPVSSLAGIGSSLLEMATLSALTGNMTYLSRSRRCLERLFALRSGVDLLGKHIDTGSLRWTEAQSCFGRNSDSFYEYLLKGSILLNDPQLFDMFAVLDASFDTYTRSSASGWFGATHSEDPSMLLAQSYSLSAFWPGVQFLLGDVAGGKKTLMRFLYAWDYFGYLPEFFSVSEKRIIHGGENYPLRPELVESMMYHDIVFGNGEMVHWGKMILEQLRNTMTKCGFASVLNMLNGELEPEMPSFVLSETFKYLYLLYDNRSVFRSRDYLYTTEGHVLNITHIQRSEGIAEFVRERNRVYAQSNSTVWDLRCSAVYGSEFLSSLRRSFPSTSSVKHGSGIPRQCPAKTDQMVLMDPSVFEDHVFYSRDNSTLSSERKAVLMQNLISAMKGSMGGVEPRSTIQFTIDPNEMDSLPMENGRDSPQRIVIKGENALEELIKYLEKTRGGNVIVNGDAD
ncbi:hypothetical protein WA588_000870 [Blastocystis sp. NMH]